mgnify:CR=1 FL=1
MKVIHLISGGDSGGAKTHVLSLLQNLSRTIDVTMVCFLEGPFAQEARELDIRTEVYPGRNVLHTLRLLQKKIRTEGYDLIHCHGARGNMMGAMLRRSTGLWGLCWAGLPACLWSPPSTPITGWTIWAAPSPVSATAR